MTESPDTQPLLFDLPPTSQNTSQTAVTADTHGTRRTHPKLEYSTHPARQVPPPYEPTYHPYSHFLKWFNGIHLLADYWHGKQKMKDTTE